MTEILCIWISINIIALFVLFLMFIDGTNDSANFSFVNPIVIYNHIKVNWFGTWLLAIVFNVLFPAIAIPYWIYKICTIGR